MSERHGGKAGADGHRRKVIIVAVAAVILALVVLLGAWGISVSHANARAQAEREASASASASASSSRAAAKRKASAQASESAAAKAKESAAPAATSGGPSSAGQPDPLAQPNPGGECVQYQGAYTNSLGQTATLAPNCSVSAPDFAGHVTSVQLGAPGASGQVAGALEIELEPNHNHAMAYTLFPAGVGAGYPGEDVSHARLINHSGGPVSAMSYQDFIQSAYMLR
ncbi:hypothetical protein BACT_0944 [Bifidobacterium actinocoloniiforme DSM 22766]|uniref:Uncharacterized protein n=1 Tax=Bifidobacterium actinocoloniiforme DSM 22766 TaxID=1437605 RepID=A0A086Z142_9BIFI|nr:hypothetical protein [Bifidobacterium actinocoloniiforme]AKV55415.1 hypothetical protein AB656_03330 [Bifidobacterium actinocoloniiforme DSM 22766]KFI40242.1 hypothetical protein BACT_0944 [Bifidobacterium actinocoloniiforme DSM 22766]